MKSVLVTGGFIGSNLIQLLAKHNYNIFQLMITAQVILILNYLM